MPVSPDNGIVDTSNGLEYLSTIMYSCLPGFMAVGNISRICQADGQWSGTEPICEGVALIVPWSLE